MMGPSKKAVKFRIFISDIIFFSWQYIAEKKKKKERPKIKRLVKTYGEKIPGSY